MRKFFVPFALILGAFLSLALQRPATAEFDDWSGKREFQVPFRAAITNGTFALVSSALSTSTEQDGVAKAQCVRAMTITNTASGYVALYSHAASGTPAGSDLIGIFAVIANTPLVVPESVCGQGLFGRVGDPISVDATTGTVTMQLRMGVSATSPKK